MISQGILLSLLPILSCCAQDSLGAGTLGNRHQIFDALLRKHVRNERVDYLRLRADDWQQLQTYLQDLAHIDPSELSRDQRLAFYINLYNASMISAIIKDLGAGFSTSENDYAIFAAPLVEVAGKKVSLNHIEHEIVRKEFAEPRIHIALVCGARSCPPLMARAYTAENLETSLERNMRRFVNDEFRNRLSATKLELSRIFEWYQADFGGEDGLRRFLGRYSEIDPARAELGYLDYSWELNMAVPAQGRWVHLELDLAGLHRGDYLEVISSDSGSLLLRRPFGGGEVRVKADQVQDLASF